MTRPTHPCGREFLGLDWIETASGRPMVGEVTRTCGESDAYCSTCAEPVLRRQRDEARELLLEIVVWFRIDFGDGIYESHVDNCARWEHGLDEECDCPIGRAEAVAAPTPGGAERETG